MNKGITFLSIALVLYITPIYAADNSITNIPIGENDKVFRSTGFIAVANDDNRQDPCSLTVALYDIRGNLQTRAILQYCGLYYISISNDGWFLVSKPYEGDQIRAICYDKHGKVQWEHISVYNLGVFILSPNHKYAMSTTGSHFILLDGRTGKPLSCKMTDIIPSEERTNGNGDVTIYKRFLTHFDINDNILVVTTGQIFKYNVSVDSVIKRTNVLNEKGDMLVPNMKEWPLVTWSNSDKTLFVVEMFEPDKGNNSPTWLTIFDSNLKLHTVDRLPDIFNNAKVIDNVVLVALRTEKTITDEIRLYRTQTPGHIVLDSVKVIGGGSFADACRVGNDIYYKLGDRNTVDKFNLETRKLQHKIKEDMPAAMVDGKMVRFMLRLEDN